MYRIGIIVFLMLGSLKLFASNLEISNELSFYLNSISGDGKSASAYDDGLKLQDIVTIFKEGKNKWGNYSYNMSFLATNDESIDPKKFILNNLSAKVSNKKRTITVGDIYDFFSQYSLTSTLKGISYKRLKNSKGIAYTMSTGFAYARWDSFYGDSSVKTIPRKVVGGRVSGIKIGHNTKVALNSVIVRDGDPRTKNDKKFETQMISGDWKYHPFKGLDITGESAIANGKIDEKNSKTATAHKIKMVGDGQGLRGVIEIERVGSYFDNPVGGAIKDRLKYKTTWRYKKNRLLWYQIGMLWFRNNLDGQLANTTESLRPSFKINKKRVFHRRHSNMAFSYNLTMRKNSLTEQKNHFLALTYSDRFKKRFRFNSNVGYNIFSTKKSITDQKQWMFDVGISTRKNFSNYSLKPFFKIAKWITEDDLALSTDKSTNYSLGTSVSWYKYDLDATISIGKYGLDREKGDDSDRVFFNLDANYAPKYLEKYWNSTLICSASYSKYSFTNSSQDFKETRILVGINSRL